MKGESLSQHSKLKTFSRTKGEGRVRAIVEAIFKEGFRISSLRNLQYPIREEGSDVTYQMSLVPSLLISQSLKLCWAVCIVGSKV